MIPSGIKNILRHIKGMGKRTKRKTMKEDPFVSALIERLKLLKRDQEVREKLQESLQKFCANRSRLSTKTICQCVTKQHELQKKVQRVHWEESVQQGMKKMTSPAPETKVVKRDEIWKYSSQTVVGYCFGRNSVPFITRVRGKNITLAHFKTLFNRKGFYRYFFKKYSNEFGTDIVFEEVTNDEDILPLWDSKIFAIVEEVDCYKL